MPDDLSAEDAKLVTLARGARGRIGAATGAALRDETGRTYSAADVVLPSLTVTSLELAIAQAVAAGARGAEAAAVVTDDPDAFVVPTALAELSPTALLIVCRADGTVERRMDGSGP
ncbi:MAG: cytidine deaminase [Actinomycetota bacterium]